MGNEEDGNWDVSPILRYKQFGDWNDFTVDRVVALLKADLSLVCLYMDQHPIWSPKSCHE